MGESKRKTVVDTLVAIGMIAVVSVYAISQGVDANVAYIAIIAIAGLGGYQVHRETS